MFGRIVLITLSVVIWPLAPLFILLAILHEMQLKNNKK